MYVDFDVHHGDGVEAIHAADPGVLTFSIHESGRYLFPGTGFAWEVGAGEAAGTVVNVPLEPETGEVAWWSIVSSLVPDLAAAFSPDIIVSQHGCDTHATDPLAHINGSTTMIGRAARLVDELAHRWTGGRWLATGGGGYQWATVVPRAWTIAFAEMAGAELPDALPEPWIEELERDIDGEVPATFSEPPLERDELDGRTERTIDEVKRACFPSFGLRP